MHMYLDRYRKEYQARLASDPNRKNWSMLANLTLCEVILFNRRREGEVSLLTADFSLFLAGGWTRTISLAALPHHYCADS